MNILLVFYTIKDSVVHSFPDHIPLSRSYSVNTQALSLLILKTTMKTINGSIRPHSSHVLAQSTCKQACMPVPLFTASTKHAINATHHRLAQPQWCAPRALTAQSMHGSRSDVPPAQEQAVVPPELAMMLKVKLGLAQSTNKLDLTDCRLRSVPPQVFELTELEVCACVASSCKAH